MHQSKPEFSSQEPQTPECLSFTLSIAAVISMLAHCAWKHTEIPGLKIIILNHLIQYITASYLKPSRT